jgi:uracil-DNA glycosylase
MSLDAILADIAACRACAGELPHEPRPVTRVSAQTRLLICGQAPGRRVHESGIPFDDPSGRGPIPGAATIRRLQDAPSFGGRR